LKENHKKSKKGFSTYMLFHAYAWRMPQARLELTTN
jgi:hypothetical protein